MLMTTALVTGTHLECVCSDHNKYYRTYEVYPTGKPEKSFLVRNWGRRGAPAGQWMIDSTIGERGVVHRSHDLQDEKICKGYDSIHTTEFQLDQITTSLLFSSDPKAVNEHGASVIAARFEAQWCIDIESMVEDLTDDIHFGWIADWSATLIARAPARKMRDLLGGRVLMHDTQRDVAVVKLDRGEISMLTGAFDRVDTVRARVDDDENTARIAHRLWSPDSSGPYKVLANAMRDARRLFRRKPLEAASEPTS